MSSIPPSDVHQLPLFPLDRCCKNCGIVKPLSDFYVKNKRTGGLFTWCKQCEIQKTTAYHAVRKDAANKAGRAWHRRNREHDREIQAARRQRNRKPVPERAWQREVPPLRNSKKPADGATPASGVPRRCTICGESKPVDQFHFKNRKTGVLKSRCKTCRTLEKRAYRAAHSDAIKASAARYYAANKEMIAERQRRWREDHPGRALAISSRSKHRHTDTVNASTHRRRARLKGLDGSWTATEWESLKATYDYRCLCCGRQEPEIKLCADHVIPVSKGGANTIANLEPLCKSCNSLKGRRLIDYRPKV